MAHSERRSEAIEIAAGPLRELQRSEIDEIGAAQRALRRADKEHERALRQARSNLKAARTARPLAAHGRRLILYEDRLSTPDRNYPLTSSVTARVEQRSAGDRGRREVALVVAGDRWSEVIEGSAQEEGELRALAERIEAACRAAETVGRERGADADDAEQAIATASAGRRAVEEARVLVHRLGEVLGEREDVLDMAAAISAGHDGVLVATDERLLFVALRRSLSFGYANISSVAVKGRWFGSRLTLATPSGKGVFSGLAPRHAAELAELIRQRTGPEPAAV